MIARFVDAIVFMTMTVYLLGQYMSPAIAEFEVASREFGYVFPFDEPHWVVA
jgi:hypothetical protein